MECHHDGIRGRKHRKAKRSTAPTGTRVPRCSNLDRLEIGQFFRRHEQCDGRGCRGTRLTSPRRLALTRQGDRYTRITAHSGKAAIVAEHRMSPRQPSQTAEVWSVTGPRPLEERQPVLRRGQPVRAPIQGYSCLSAVDGSSFVARRAGKYDALNVATSSAAATPASVAGSAGLV